MSAIPNKELQAFHDFLSEKLKNGAAELFPEDILNEWRVLHPDPWEFDDEDDVAAIQAALDDIANGEVGMPFEEFDREFRRQHNIPGPP